MSDRVKFWLALGGLYVVGFVIARKYNTNLGDWQADNDEWYRKASLKVDAMPRSIPWEERAAARKVVDAENIRRIRSQGKKFDADYEAGRAEFRRLFKEAWGDGDD